MDRRDVLTGLSGVTLFAVGGTVAHAASLSQANASAALKTALDQGTKAAVTRLSAADGYWGDSKVRIPLPKTLTKIQKTLKPMGLSGALDDLHLSLNRAAEGAAPLATDLFIAAIKDMTISDAVGIVKGSNTAGTQYLQRTTTPRLTAAFTPPMMDALDNAGAVDYLEKAIERNKLQKYVKTDPKTYLGEHSVKLALDGLFYYIGTEETAIRKDPAKRVSDILKSVFG